eukprot:CAMPEP_0197537968 /NCGR_PEP_ID=MMETSP1318-20131121/58408_1 /TAXON_ID=552666 /ORGANISM="Partenskyella glossopodia, Strain RCC365" /LENGTH=534 /DNA_ID=CAMNT_0043096255 /DNA_START=1 /DNA_END=1602 /DNA_ORIENTATION=-
MDVTQAGSYFVFIGALSTQGSMRFMHARADLGSSAPLISVGVDVQEMELVVATGPSLPSTTSDLNVTIALNGQQFYDNNVLAMSTYTTPQLHYISPTTVYPDEEAILTIYTDFLNDTTIDTRFEISQGVYKYATAYRTGEVTSLPADAGNTSTSTQSSSLSLQSYGDVYLQTTSSNMYTTYQLTVPTLIQSGSNIVSGPVPIQVSLNGLQYTALPASTNLTVASIEACRVISDDFESSLIRSYQFSTNTGVLGTYCSTAGDLNPSDESLEFRNTGERILETKSIDTTLGGYVDFWLLYGGESTGGDSTCSGPLGTTYDLYLQYTHDDVTWTTFHTVTSTGTTRNWVQHAVNLPALAQASYTKIRWYQPATGGTNRGTYGLDNLHVHVNPNSQGSGMKITGFSPKSGPITGNTIVHVYGQNFTNQHTLTCLFGGSQGNASYEATYINSSTIICRTPAVPAAKLSVVHICGSTSGTSELFRFYEEPTNLAPSVASIPLSQVVGASNVQYLVQGNNLFGSTEVKVRYTEATGTKTFN